jgi:hypothetical protein
MTIDPEPHPVAALFPAMLEPELSVLADDIAEHGLLQPIVLDGEGRLLDGSNRLAACKIAGIDPRFTTFTGDDPLGYCVSVNVRRRHLSLSQLATLAVELEPVYAEQAKQRQRRSGGDKRSDHRPVPLPVAEPSQIGEALGQAAKAVGVGRSTARAAKRVKTEAPEKYEQIQTGGKTVKAAEREIKHEAIAATDQAVDEVVAFVANGDAASQLAAAASSVLQALYRTMIMTAEIDPTTCAKVVAPTVASTYTAEVDRTIAWLSAFRAELRRPRRLETVNGSRSMMTSEQQCQATRRSFAQTRDATRRCAPTDQIQR